MSKRSRSRSTERYKNKFSGHPDTANTVFKSKDACNSTSNSSSSSNSSNNSSNSSNISNSSNFDRNVPEIFNIFYGDKANAVYFLSR